MKFTISETRNHWLFGHSYNAHLLESPSLKKEILMTEWLHTLPNGRGFTWYNRDIICFQNEHDRTLFIMKFS